MPRIHIRYDADVVDPAELATIMPALAEMGARQYFTTPDKVVVELFEQNRHSLGHRTLDVEISALPDPEGRREGQIEAFALEMVTALLQWLEQRGLEGNVGAETRIFASGAFAWAPSGGTAEVTHTSRNEGSWTLPEAVRRQGSPILSNSSGWSRPRACTDLPS